MDVKQPTIKTRAAISFGHYLRPKNAMKGPSNMRAPPKNQGNLFMNLLKLKSTVGHPAECIMSTLILQGCFSGVQLCLTTLPCLVVSQVIGLALGSLWPLTPTLSGLISAVPLLSIVSLQCNLTWKL